LEKFRNNLGIASLKKCPLKSSNSSNAKKTRKTPTENKSNLERKLKNLILESFEEEKEIITRKKENFQCKKNSDLAGAYDYEMRLEHNIFDAAANNDFADEEISNLNYQEKAYLKKQIFPSLEYANDSVFGSKNKSPELIDISKQENAKSINETIQTLLLL